MGLIFLLSILSVFPLSVYGTTTDNLSSDRGRACKFIDTLPFVIDTSGAYCLADHLSFDGTAARDAITINANNVRIDGRGFGITGPRLRSTTNRGILAINRNGITIENIRVTGFLVSILIGSNDKTAENSSMFGPNRSSRNIKVHNVSSVGATFQGIDVSADNFDIQDNVVSGVGPTGVYPDAFATAISARGNGCQITNNRVILGQASGTGENVGISIDLGSGCTVSKNNVLFQNFPEFGMNYGIWTRASRGGLALISDNFVSGAHYGFGPTGIFKNNTSVHTTCALFTKRPSLENTLVDVEGNRAVFTPMVPQIGSTTCMHDIEVAKKRFHSTPSAGAAYQIASAYTERYPVRAQAELLSWLIVAAHLGHAGATEATASPEKGGYIEKDIVRGRELAKEILRNSGLSVPAN